MEIDTAGNLLNKWVPINANTHESNYISLISIDTIVVVCGTKNNSGFNDWQPMISGINAQGQLLWTHYFPPTGNLHFVGSVVQLNNQEFMFYWCQAVKQGSSPWVWVHHLVKMDIAGNILWDKPVFYSYHQNGRLKHLDNGNVMYSGVFKDTLGGPMNGYLVMFDTTGTILWDRTFVISPGFQWFRDGAQTMDGGFIMTGNADGTHIDPITLDLSSDLWIVKTDSNGLITSDNQLDPPPLAQSHLSPPYPNPANEYSMVDVIIPPNIEKALLHVFDITGKEISTFTLHEGLSQLKIETSHLKNGTYLLAMSLNGYKDDVQKLVVSR
ncbi:MAG: T9SS type A sorting domain-containing protein [Bacteroidetes bacterium]|nr:T9SS type A sorting domain-containing protein [Bacteroidota bacterium]